MRHQPLNDLIDPEVPAADAPAPLRTPETRGKRYQPLNDLIDPDVPAADAPAPEPEPDPDAPEDAYVIGRPGKMILTLKADADKDREGSRAWVKPVAILSAVAFAGLTIWNLSKLVQGPPAPPAPTPFHMKQALYMGAVKIEAYRREHGVTPESVNEVGLSSPPYSYRRLNPNAYAMGVDLHGTKLEYDSSVSLEQFFGSPREMLNTENNQ